ncbi:hypothetical protein PTSG_03405 [Salpingoeca rosetta]|uniref:RING-type domain-containing protein n=1 Tax=Salpingoeca rosetta (strain ATCC 50818 / BSB-021) TaxID=946362 RepID=F2U538_SALR5|nr:uncharacterized protein PTSG_03405 [Salpingoeca rosetta]EGD82754.1 hypothetical protein PTSG_03405 [Salpingoeca rosetta]|eukprot:XP_004995990.1 hypothetical protein PTSG_03405 [Salpingoeca rosetta]
MATNVEEDDDLVVVLDDEDESDVATQGQPADDAGGDDPDSLVLIGDDDQDDDVNGNDDGSGGDHAQAQATQQQPPQDGQQQPPAVKPQPLQPQDDDLPEVLDLEPTTSAAATTTAASAADESENVLCCLSKKLIRRRRAMLLPCCHNMCSIKQWTEHVTKQSNDSSKVCPACSAYVPASLLLKHLPMSTCVEMAHAAVEMLQRHGRRHAVKALSLPRLQALLTTLAKTVKGRQVRKRRSYARSSQVTHKGRKTAWTKGVGFGGSSGTSVASRLRAKLVYGPSSSYGLVDLLH